LRRLRRLHEHLRILFQLCLNPWVGLQILLKVGVIFLVFLAIGQRRILGEILGDAAMVAKELTESFQFTSRHVMVAILVPIEPLFLPHETVWVLADFLAHSRVLLQVFLQRRMFFDKLVISNQRGVSP
jgi:hypothetical protein